MSRLQIPWPVRLLLGLSLLAIVLLYYDTESAVRALGATRWWLAAPAIAGLVLVHLVGAATWRMLTRRLAGMHLPWRSAIRTYYAAQALGTVTPASIGADAYRVRAIRSAEIGWRRAVVPVAVHRAMSYLSLAVLASVAALLIPVAVTVRIGLVAMPLVAVLAAGGIYLSKRRHGERDHHEASRSAWSAAASALVQSAAFHAVAVLLTYVLVLAVDPNVEPSTALAALMVARVAAFLPLTPAGLGLQEGAFALLLPEAGISAEAAVAVSALTRVAMLVTLAAGALALSATANVLPDGSVELDARGGTKTISR